MGCTGKEGTRWWLSMAQIVPMCQPRAGQQLWMCPRQEEVTKGPVPPSLGRRRAQVPPESLRTAEPHAPKTIPALSGLSPHPHRPMGKLRLPAGAPRPCWETGGWGCPLKTSKLKPLARGYFASPQPCRPRGHSSRNPETRLQRRRGQASTSGKISSLPLLQSLSPAAEGANWNKYSVEILQYFPLARALSLFFWVVSTAVDSVSWFNYNKIYSIYCK